MKPTEVKLDEWAGIDGELESSGTYFKPKLDTPYRLVFKSAKPAEPDERFKNAQGKPKARVVLTMKSVNGEASEFQWTTGAFDVMREVRAVMKAGKLEQTEFLLKKKEEEGKTRYIFERLGELPGRPASPSVGAYV